MDNDSWLTMCLIQTFEQDINEDESPYSLSTLAEAINSYTQIWLGTDVPIDMEVTKNHVHSWVSVRAGKEKPSLPTGNRRKAVEKFIVECTTIGKEFRGKIPDKETPIPLSAVTLANELYKGSDLESLTTSQIKGEYTCHLNASNHRIKFSTTNNSRVLFVDMEVSDRISKQTYDYSGWAVISPEANVLVFAKSHKEPTNQYTFVIECDDDAHDNDDVLVESFVAFSQLNAIGKPDQSQNDTDSNEDLIHDSILHFKRLEN
jgi:hypothetical protein